MFQENRSLEISYHLQNSCGRRGLLVIPLTRNLLMKDNNEFVNEIVGAIHDFIQEVETFSHPSGHTTTYNIVTKWRVIPKDKLNIWNSNISTDERERVLVTIPYELINIDRVAVII